MSRSALFEKGLKIRKEVVGEEYVQRAFDKAGDFGRDFQELVTEFCWGASWGREALSRRDRSLLNIVMLGTLGRNAELALHLRGALRNGVTPDEIRDALIQLTIYAGVPAGVESFRIAQDVLENPETQPTAPSKGPKP
ncbi:4-carboxymuconolactone decarboxylase [Mesorhizobium sp. CU2]|uniref:carboxymuconolactone decarboxylase family protein n=1 Tax=unclassified Mesorhizobium TaxID=325217 RepID=UPI00112E82FD|nr:MULTISPECIES: carboxymuconolactone decarboxylase family protein [unclassified Mesorhizobium]TPN85629.1 4-carboxymuconolactone decarboxylase [Mesorhizobium sp. CU3]TPO04710.1 4-carboxymuconolactone decarboxylase [Mesorhizobium sp. CU2]